MLIIMKDRNVHDTFEFLFDIETVWSLNILQIDSTEGGSQVSDTVDEGVWILDINTDINRLYASELAKKHSLPFHDRFSS